MPGTIPGLERFLAAPPPWISGQRIGLVVSASSVDAALVSTVERFHAAEAFRLVALFGPEHGLRGEAQAGEGVSGSTDHVTGLPVYSLYGDTKKPTAAMQAEVDVFVIDMQDGGSRFYTYLYTMAYVMQAAAEHGRKVVVLDRPAPLNGVSVQGPVLDPAYASFVGLYPIPIRYGLTIGECARLFNEAFGIGCDLTVIPLAGWRRALWADETGLPFIPPSPNLPTLSALTLFPGTCLVEGTNLSEGRGTTMPFAYIGAPWIAAPERLAAGLNALELPGVRFRAVYFTPTFSKHAGEACRGVHVVITDREACRPVEVGLYLLQRIREEYPAQFEWRPPWDATGHYPIDLLSGGSQVRACLDAGRSIPDLVESWQEPLAAFDDLRVACQMYPD
ncbi:MAG: DUF1343 domain-containing protein [Anaerolineae bacterium]|nr:DUF1343 domain-containing protein [Anaerolineae bacterium]